MKRWMELILVLAIVSLGALFWRGTEQPYDLPLEGQTLQLWVVNEAGLKLAQESAKILHRQCGAESSIMHISAHGALFDHQRGQWSADGLLKLRGALKEGEKAILVLEEDLYTPSQPDWRYCFGVHGQNSSVLSRHRLQSPGHWEKMLCRYSVVRLLGPRQSSNPQSLFFSPVLGPEDVERMELRFDLD